MKSRSPFVQMDVLDTKQVYDVIKKNKVTQVYMLAALLSATAEQKVKLAWKLNMESLLGLLDLAKEEKLQRESPGVRVLVMREYDLIRRVVSRCINPVADVAAWR